MTFDAVDWIVRLLPAAGIVAGGFAAWTQLKAARRATATTIAKNYYRKMLDQFLRNSDVLYAGTDPASFQLLKQDKERYRRYRLLFTNMAFACQEMYLALDMQKDTHWKNAIRAFILIFRHHIQSEEDFPTFIQESLHPQFLEYMKKVTTQYEHPVSAMRLDH